MQDDRVGDQKTIVFDSVTTSTTGFDCIGVSCERAVFDAFEVVHDGFAVVNDSFAVALDITPVFTMESTENNSEKAARMAAISFSTL